MPPPRPHLLTPLVERVFQTRTVHDARRYVRAIQLVLTFGLLIVLPVLLLAYFALASIQQSTASIEADLAPRTTVIMEQVHAEERELFDRFETQVERRLLRNVKPVTGLDDLAPHLLAAYALDATGRITEPFDIVEVDDEPPPNAAYDRAWREGMVAEREGRHDHAAELLEQAEQFTTSTRLQAQAAMAAARNRVALGDDGGVYADVIGEYGTIRDPRGFRIGDIARLNQAELAAVKRNDGFALRELAQDLIDDARWTLFEGGEPTVARRALDRLEDLKSADPGVDTAWISRARRRLERRDAQLFWSGRLADEMTDLTASPPSPAQGFVYRPSASSPALWAVRNTGKELVIYAFDREEILSRLRRTATRLAALDADLVASVGRVDQGPLGSAVFRQPLDRLPMHAVRVAAANPDKLAQERRNRTFARIAIILLALATSVVGVAVTVRYVTRELAAARIKTDFAANVSHELRSPITQIRLKGEALQLDLVFDADDRQAHYDAIVREAERLSRLVDNVLDFAAIERGAKKYTFRPEDVTELIYYAVDTHRTQLQSVGMKVEVDVPDDLPVVWIDREAISQVLTNLLSNAAKYGADGNWLGVKARATDAHMQIRVADRGMGISSDDQSRIFEDFFRSSSAAVRRQKGTGIGLTIVRYIVEAHRGTIAVESAPGEGTTFVIDLPLQPPTGAGA
ncbi:MAG: sensor histidine kinase [Myxococcota bacterium]